MINDNYEILLQRIANTIGFIYNYKKSQIVQYRKILDNLHLSVKAIHRDDKNTYIELQDNKTKSTILSQEIAGLGM